MRFVLTVSDRGVISLPAKLRKMFGLQGNDQLIAETTSEGVLLKPCVTLPIEIYSDERIREFEESESELAAYFEEKSAR